jgi:hypothetical protein
VRQRGEVGLDGEVVDKYTSFKGTWPVFEFKVKPVPGVLNAATFSHGNVLSVSLKAKSTSGESCLASVEEKGSARCKTATFSVQRGAVDISKSTFVCDQIRDATATADTNPWVRPERGIGRSRRRSDSVHREAL